MTVLQIIPRESSAPSCPARSGVSCSARGRVAVELSAAWWLYGGASIDGDWYGPAPER